MIEPAYELANDEAKKRMESHGYITNLYETAIELGYKVESYELLGVNLNPLNPVGIMVIRKGEERLGEKNALCDPITKGELIKNRDSLYCPDTLLAYPIISQVPILLSDSAIIATKYMEFDNTGEIL